MSDQPDLFAIVPQPERPGASPTGAVAQAILAELRKSPGAVDHIADRLGYPLDETRKAFRALIHGNRVVDTLERIETPTFKFSIVWAPAT